MRGEMPGLYGVVWGWYWGHTPVMHGGNVPEKCEFIEKNAENAEKKNSVPFDGRMEPALKKIKATSVVALINSDIQILTRVA